MSRLVQARFETSDVDELVDQLRPVSPGVKMVPKDRYFSASVDLIRTPRVGLFDIGAGATRVLLDPGQRDYWSVSFNQGGHFHVLESGRKLRLGAGEAHLLDGTSAFDFHADASSHYAVVNPDATLVETQLRARGIDAQAKLGAERVLSLKSDAGASLERFARYFWSELEAGSPAFRTRLVLAEAEDLLASLIVEAWVPSASQAAGSMEREAGPDWLGRAEEYLASHLEDPVSLSQVAEAAGVSVRTLTRGFRSRHDVGPMHFLRERRLEAVRRVLLAGSPDDTHVTDVAFRHGFAHLGRFASTYRRRFGELPSETLAR